MTRDQIRLGMRRSGEGVRCTRGQLRQLDQGGKPQGKSLRFTTAVQAAERRGAQTRKIASSGTPMHRHQLEQARGAVHNFGEVHGEGLELQQSICGSGRRQQQADASNLADQHPVIGSRPLGNTQWPWPLSQQVRKSRVREKVASFIGVGDTLASKVIYRAELAAIIVPPLHA